MAQCLHLLAKFDFVVQNNKSDTITKVHYISLSLKPEHSPRLCTQSHR